jgi:hypothetical protein
MQRYLFSAYVTSFSTYVTSFSAYHFPVLFQNKNSFSSQNLFFNKFYYFPKFSFSAQNLFLLSILQYVIASKSNHINTMLPNEMVLPSLQKLKIKYELSYQSTTRLKYIDKFDQLLIIHQWTSTVDDTTIVDTFHNFYLILCSKTFPIIYK